MIPIQPLASSAGSGQAPAQRREVLRAKSAFYRELLARRHDAYSGSEALPLPADGQSLQGEPQHDQWIRATMSFPGGVSLTVERATSDEAGETTTSVALTRRRSTARRAAPLPQHLDIRV